MGQHLRTAISADGLIMRETACEHYRCASCGRGMISVNFVTGICIQVFVSHGATCRLFPGNAYRRTCQVSCATCSYYKEESGCGYKGAPDARIESVRTAGIGR